MKRNWASELRAIADGRLLLNVRNGVTVSRSMLAMIADEIDALRATATPPDVAGAELDPKLERMLSKWESPAYQHVMLPGTAMTCDLAAPMIRAATALRLSAGGAARIEALEAENAELRKKLNGCQWYWPEDDTSEDCCGESAQEIVQNAYDWSSKNAGKVVAVARGGIVEVMYCAALPPADDADSDDDFWVEAETEEAAQAMLDAEIARRACEGGNTDG